MCTGAPCQGRSFTSPRAGRYNAPAIAGSARCSVPRASAAPDRPPAPGTGRPRSRSRAGRAPRVPPQRRSACGSDIPGMDFSSLPPARSASWPPSSPTSSATAAAPTRWARASRSTQPASTPGGWRGWPRARRRRHAPRNEIIVALSRYYQSFREPRAHVQGRRAHVHGRRRTRRSRWSSSPTSSAPTAPRPARCWRSSPRRAPAGALLLPALPAARRTPTRIPAGAGGAVRARPGQVLGRCTTRSSRTRCRSASAAIKQLAEEARPRRRRVGQGDARRGTVQRRARGASKEAGKAAGVDSAPRRSSSTAASSRWASSDGLARRDRGRRARVGPGQ